MTDYLSEHAHVELRVGARTTTAGAAKAYVQRYLNTPGEHWSYPAYDGYPGTAGPLVGPQDLFAPMLLNAPIRKLRTYYELVDVLPELNERLRDLENVPLADSQPEAIFRAARILGIFDVRPAIFGVGFTTLTKILHRKRPALLPLWDKRIERCYHTDPGAPVPYVRGRTWETFAATWLEQVRGDLTRTREVRGVWEELATLTPTGDPRITPLRALDIVGWHLGAERGQMPADGHIV